MACCEPVIVGKRGWAMLVKREYSSQYGPNTSSLTRTCIPRFPSMPGFVVQNTDDGDWGCGIHVCAENRAEGWCFGLDGFFPSRHRSWDSFVPAPSLPHGEFANF